MKLLKTGIAALLAIVLLPACDLINPDEKIPAYLYVGLFEVADNPNVAEGSLDQQITNAQVYVGNEYLGLFTLPTVVPVLQEGTQTVYLDPVVKENGRTFSLNIYPFYQRVEYQLDLVPAQTDSLYPVTAYTDETVFGFIENFELGSSIFEVERDGNENTFMDVSTEVVYEGNRSGWIFLDEDNILVDVGTAEDQLFELAAANDVWLEMNVRSDVDVFVGLVGYDNVGNTASEFEWGALAGEEWRKLYFNLTPQVILSGFEEYAIALTAGLPVENGSLVLKEANLYFDNIKLLYR